MPLPAHQKLFSIGEASSILNVSADTLRRSEKNGKIKTKRGKYNERLYSLDDVILLKGILKKRLPTQKMYSVKQTANLLNVSSQTIRRWEREGRIKATRSAGGHRRFTPDSIQNVKDKKYQQVQKITKDIIPTQQTPIPSTPYQPNFPVFKLISFATIGTLLVGFIILSLNSRGNIKSTLLEGIGNKIGKILPGYETDYKYEGDVKIKGTVTIEGIIEFLDSPHFTQGAVFGSSTLSIDNTGNLTTDQTITANSLAIVGAADMYRLNVDSSITVAGNEIINSSGKIPALNGYYFENLSGENITNVDAHHLGGQAASSFLRSNEPDTAEAVLTFTASPGSVDVNGGPLYINPSASSTNYTLFGVAVDGVSKFKVDTEGDISLTGSIASTGSRVIKGWFTDLEVTNLPTFGGIAIDSTFLKLDASNDPITGDLLLKPTSNSTTTLQVQKSDTTPVFNVDTTNGRVGIGTATPTYALHIVGERVLISNPGATAYFEFSGSNSLIQNDAGNFWFRNFAATGDIRFSTRPAGADIDRMYIEFGGNIGVGNSAPAGKFHITGTADDEQLIVQAHSSQAANILEIQNSSNDVLSGVDERGILFSDGNTDVSNVIIGNNAGVMTMTGTDNILIGNNAGNSALTTASANIGIGRNVLRLATDTTGNVAIGSYAMYNADPGINNLALGSYSLTKVTGTYNIGIGTSALNNATSANWNVGIGGRAGISLTTGDSNIFIGAYAGSRQTTLSNLLIIDNQTRTDVAEELTNSILYGVMAAAPTSQTLRINALTGINTTPTAQLHVVGNADIIQTVIKAHSSQAANILEIQNSSNDILSGVDERGILFSDGGSNVSNFFAGLGAGNIAATGVNNVGIGSSTLLDLTDGEKNMAIGSLALTNVTSGDTNVGIGYYALGDVTTTSNNIGIGRDAGRYATGNRNTAIGTKALFGVSTETTASDGVYIGYYSGLDITTAVGNTLIGTYSGDSLTTGGSNIIIGYQAGRRQTTLSNLLIIDNQLRADVAEEITNSILYGVMDAVPTSQTLRVNALTGINTTPSYALDVLASGTGIIARFNSGNNSGCTLADGGTISCTSDEELKTNIEDLSPTSLSQVLDLHPVAFDWKSGSGDYKSLGFLAHEVESIFPGLVSEDSQTGYLQLNTISLVPVLTKAIQEQQNQINSIASQSATPINTSNNENESENLDTRISDLEARILLLESDQVLGESSVATSSSSFLNSLAVLGDSVLGDTVITGKLDVGILSFDNLSGSIDAIGKLKLQSLALDSIEFLGGSIEMNQKGNLDIKKGVLKGNDSFRGSVTLVSGEMSIAIERSWEESPASVTATPNYNTNIWVTDKTDNGFIIHVDKPSQTDQAIDWLAIW